MTPYFVMGIMKCSWMSITVWVLFIYLFIICVFLIYISLMWKVNVNDYIFILFIFLFVFMTDSSSYFFLFLSLVKNRMILWIHLYFHFTNSFIYVFIKFLIIPFYFGGIRIKMNFLCVGEEALTLVGVLGWVPWDCKLWILRCLGMWLHPHTPHLWSQKVKLIPKPLPNDPPLLPSPLIKTSGRVGRGIQGNAVAIERQWRWKII